MRFVLGTAARFAHGADAEAGAEDDAQGDSRAGARTDQPADFSSGPRGAAVAPSRRALLSGGVGASIAALGVGNPHPTGCSPRPSAGEPALLALDRSQGVVLVLDSGLAPVRVLRLPAPSCCCSLPNGGALVGAAMTGEASGPHRILVLDRLGRAVEEVPPVAGLHALALETRAEPYEDASAANHAWPRTGIVPRSLDGPSPGASSRAVRGSTPIPSPHGEDGTHIVWALARRGGAERLLQLTPEGWRVVWSGLQGEVRLTPWGPLLGAALMPLASRGGALPLGPGDRLEHLSWGLERVGTAEPTALVRRVAVSQRAPELDQRLDLAGEGPAAARDGAGDEVWRRTPDQPMSSAAGDQPVRPLGRPATRLPARPSGPFSGDPGTRWIVTGEGLAIRRRAPPWWEVVVRSAGVLYGASVSGDRVGAMALQSGSGRPRWRERMTRTRGRTVRLLPWRGGVLLATRTALLAYDDLLLPRGQQGGLDHLVGCCRIGAPRT